MNLFAKLKKLKIILIDDDEWIRDSMRIFFEYEGCVIDTYETAEEALAAMRKQSFDIIIADYKLPGMDGIAFFNRIQASAGAPIKILITAFHSQSVADMVKAGGIHALIEKPFQPETIEATLSRLLGEKM
jgi:two-component system C4-dicarboxylate transport response regulator DctD